MELRTEGYCPSEFPPKSVKPSIAFVGEAPGKSEVAVGRPLVGSSGDLFNEMLRTADISRRGCFVGNVFNYKAPGNDIEESWCVKKADAEAAAKEAGYSQYPVKYIRSGKYLHPGMLSELDRLHRELKEANPNIVVPLGGTALWAVSQLTGIKTHRGAVHWSDFCGFKVLPTIHPAAVMRDMSQYTIIVSDLLKAQIESGYPEIRFPKRKIWLEPEREDLQFFRDKVLSADRISFDIETTFGQISCVGYATDSEEAFVIPFIDFRQPHRSYWLDPKDELAAWATVKEIQQSSVPKIAQNGMFDMQWLWQLCGIPTHAFADDTMTIHRVRYPEMPMGLGFLASVYTNSPAWKTWTKHKGTAKQED